MIQALTETLVQPLESSEPPPGPEPELELLLVMEEEQEEESAVRLVFDGDSDQESVRGFQDDDRKSPFTGSPQGPS